ncbi:hypothetical protein B0H12DRAFT_1236182 [Mycena haematopus]|nr:hypothetical protein B0H12DRAFT_1236182 [Mycena haematopus]
MSAVLSTPELLEKILVHLPIRTLLVTAPLVSKTWHAATLSPTLQRALFFAPDPSASPSTRVHNPLLVETFPPFFAFPEGNRTAWPGMDAIEAPPWSQAPAAFQRADASWRRMLVAQPPPQSMLITQDYSAALGVFERRAVLGDLSDSLRMGLLYDLTVSLIKERFRVHWRGDTTLEAEAEADPILLELSAAHSCMDEPRALDDQFRSNGEQRVEIPFTKWQTRMSGMKLVWDPVLEVNVNIIFWEMRLLLVAPFMLALSLARAAPVPVPADLAFVARLDPIAPRPNIDGFMRRADPSAPAFSEFATEPEVVESGAGWVAAYPRGCRLYVCL